MIREKTRILIVEDEKKISDVVKSYLENSGYSVYTSVNGKDALILFDRIKPKLIVLDLMLPDMDGEELCKIIRAKSRVPIMMLTAKTTEENIVQGFNIGADDYVTKPFSPRQLTARVAALLRRAEGEDPLANILMYNDYDLIIDCLKHEVYKQDSQVYLTPNEYKILLTLVKYPQKVFTREELINTVLGMDFEGSDRAIDSHIKNLRLKIETNPKEPDYILTVRGVGYKFGGNKNEVSN